VSVLDYETLRLAFNNPLAASASLLGTCMGNGSRDPLSGRGADNDKSTGCRPARRKSLSSDSASLKLWTVRIVVNAAFLMGNVSPLSINLSFRDSLPRHDVEEYSFSLAFLVQDTNKNGLIEQLAVQWGSITTGYPLKRSDSAAIASLVSSTGWIAHPSPRPQPHFTSAEMGCNLWAGFCFLTRDSKQSIERTRLCK
jgi:hypothetical protein